MKKWSQLRPGTKARYSRQGVTSRRYNAWNATGQNTRKKYAAIGITKDAFLKSPNTPTVIHKARIHEIVGIFQPQFRARGLRFHPDRFAANLFNLTPIKLRKVKYMTVDQIRLKAREAPYQIGPRVINPFWYG
jgi:hypothetical protein